MQAMLEGIAPRLPRVGKSRASRWRQCPGRDIAPGLDRLQKAHGGIAIGSYPFYREGSLNLLGRSWCCAAVMQKKWNAQPKR